MPAEAIAPVNATSTNTAPAPKAEPAPKAPAKAEPSVKQKFDSKIEETLWRVNEPTQDEVDDAKTGEDIFEKGRQNAEKSSKDATPPASGTEIHEEKPKPQQSDEKKKFKVTIDGKAREFELTQEQAERFAQKGIMHELKNRAAAERDRSIAAREAEIAKKEQELNGLAQALDERGMDALVERYGPEKAREMAEGFLRPLIEREMLPKEEREQLDIRQENEQLKRQLAERDADDQAKQTEAQQEAFREEYSQYIIKALQDGGFPRGSETQFASEMANWMRRGLAKGITFTPERLVSLVKEDNNRRVGVLTGIYVDQINAAKESGDLASVIKHGEELVGLLGEPVMYAIGKYHLAKMKQGQPMVPKPVLDTPKVAAKQEQKSNGYMSEDQYREIRQKIARGEMEPPPGW